MMIIKKNVIVCLLGLFIAVNSFGQGKYFSRDGTVTFKSRSDVEKVDAINKKATGIIDTESGIIQFSLLMKAFEFQKALMQEHFNENYVESDKFPKAVFKGKITNLSNVAWSDDGKYEVNITGEMTLHGVTKQLDLQGVLVVSDSGIRGTSQFEIKPQDYDIEIPNIVKDKISEIIDVDVDIDFKPYKK